MTTRVVRVLACGTLAALAVLAACEGQRTTENDPFGPPSYNFQLTGLSRGLPRSAGSDAVFLSFAAFDTSVADAFARKGDLAVRLRSATSWNLATTMRRLAVDGRAPTQVASAAGAAATLTLEGPEVAATAGLWRSTLSFTGLAASTGYTVALVRYGLKTGSTATDSLDQAAALLTGSAFTVRDSLFVLGGTGASPSLTGGCTTATAAVSSSTANPLIIGTFTSTAAGASGSITRCINDVAGLYYPATAVSLNKTPIAPNTGLTFALPQYNYIVVYVTASGPVTGTVLRGQIGQDLNVANGNPVNNAFAPFPCIAAANNCAASNVLSTSQRIAAPGGTANVDSVRLSLRGLKALGGSGVYQAWLVNPATGAAPVKAVGRLVATQVDTVTDVPTLVLATTVLDSTPVPSSSPAGVSSFVGFPMPQVAHVTWRLIVSSAASGVNMRDYTHVLVTLENSGAAATTPSTSTALWLQYGDQKGTADLKDDTYFDGAAGLAPAVAWGRLDLANVATRVFTAAGTGFGGVRGDEVSVDLTNLARPPAGYYYQAWLQDVNGPDGNGTDTVYVAVDTLRSPYPGRVLLVDADNSLPDPVVQDVPPVIRSASLRNFAASMGLDAARLCNDTQPARGACPFGAFENFMVTLEPKGSNAASPSPTLLFTASVPTLAKTGR
jgi:hypothetical protein